MTTFNAWAIAGWVIIACFCLVGIGAVLHHALMLLLTATTGRGFRLRRRLWRQRSYDRRFDHVIHAYYLPAADVDEQQEHPW